MRLCLFSQCIAFDLVRLGVLEIEFIDRMNAKCVSQFKIRIEILIDTWHKCRARPIFFMLPASHIVRFDRDRYHDHSMVSIWTFFFLLLNPIKYIVAIGWRTTTLFMLRRIFPAANNCALIFIILGAHTDGGISTPSIFELWNYFLFHRFVSDRSQTQTVCRESSGSVHLKCCKTQPNRMESIDKVFA